MNQAIPACKNLFLIKNENHPGNSGPSPSVSGSHYQELWKTPTFRKVGPGTQTGENLAASDSVP